MSEIETLLFLLCGVLTTIFIVNWYRYLFGIFKPKRKLINDYILGLLPFVLFIIIYYTLRNLASFDVVNDTLFIIFYIFFGFTWIYLFNKLIFLFYDISWIDDIITNGNYAALSAYVGALLGITLIYAGANIGDRPGFWCVMVAGGIGAILWFILALLINKFTGIIERVVISRDLGSGIRFGGFLLSTGIILARGSGGDWFNFWQTIIDFSDIWIIIPFAVLYLLIELYYKNKYEKENIPTNVTTSCLWLIFFIILSIYLILYVVPPFKENPIYLLLLL